LLPTKEIPPPGMYSRSIAPFTRREANGTLVLYQ